MKGETKSTYYLALFGIIFVAFIALRIIQYFGPKQSIDSNQAFSNTPTNSTNQSEEFQVVLEVRANFYNTSIQIEKDGQLTYTEVLLGSPQNQSEKITLNQAQIKELKSEIELVGFFNLNSAYRPTELATGNSIFIISVVSGEKNYSVLCETDCPDSFRQLESSIKSLWPKEFKI